MPTTVVYGTPGVDAVTLTNVLTLDWSEETAYEDSHTDQVFNRYKVTFQGLIHPDVGPLAPTQMQRAGTTSPNTAAQVYRDLRACLLEPRKPLLVTVGSAITTDSHDALSTLLQCDPCTLLSSAMRDVENGPKPVGLQLTHIAGSRAFRAVWSVECALLECCTPLSSIPFVLNNRWSIKEEMDDDFFTTRTIRGRLRISSSDVPLHSFRPPTMPPLENTFARRSIDFLAQEDGLAADYSVVDKQVKTAAPWPSTKIECEHTEATMQGAEFSSECHVKIDGPPATQTKDLITLAFQICDAKLQIVMGNFTLGTAFLEEFRVTDYVGERNSVDMLVRLMRTPVDEATGAIGGFFNSLCANMGRPLKLPNVPGYDPNKSHPPAVWGYDSKGQRDPAVCLYLLSCFLQTPCDERDTYLDVTPSSPQGGTNTQSQTQLGPTVTSSTTAQLTAMPNSLYSVSAAKTIWRYARMESRYEYDTTRVQLPIAGDVTNVGADGSVVVQLARPQMKRVIRYDAERVDAEATAPSPLDTYIDGSLKGTLLRHKITPMPPTLAPGGSSTIYRVKAEYVYAMNRAAHPGDTLLTGVLPFTNLTQDDNRFSPGIGYDPGIGPGG